MTKHIEIENYKSIKHLKLDTARVNVFIGEPNSGKSNILEALGLLSQSILDKPHFKEILRFNFLGELFYDSNTNENLAVITDELSFSLILGKNENGALENQFRGEYAIKQKKVSDYSFSFDGENVSSQGIPFSTSFRYYQFQDNKNNSISYLPHLAPPYGNNIPNLLINTPDLRRLVSDIIKRKNLRLQINANERTVSVAKEVDEIIHTYPYKAVSETLRRLIFYKLAIVTNENCSLMLDEPEANTFPIYTKEIGEMIALNSSNQFFVTTHNPYLLRSIISKTPAHELKVFVTSLKDYQTKCRPLSSKELTEVLDLDMDYFFNLPE